MNTAVLKLSDKFIGYWRVVAVILIAIGLLISATGGYMELQNNTKTVSAESTQVVSSTADYSSVAVNGTEAFESGDRIQNSPLYVEGSHTELQVNHSVSAPQPITYDTRVVVEYRGVLEGYEFWSQEEVVSNRTVEADDGQYHGETSINMTRVSQQADAIEESFRQQGRVEVIVTVETEYQTEEYSGEIVTQSNVLFAENTYSVIPPDNQANDANTVTVNRTVPDNSHRTIVVAGGLFILLGLLCVGARRISDEDRVMNDYVLRKHSDWITHAEDINYDEDMHTVEVSDPEELIDVASDVKSRVFWDESSESYVVMKDDVICKYVLSEDDVKTIRGTKPPNRAFLATEGSED